MADAAFWNIGMAPRKEDVFRGQNPLLMNYSDEQLRQWYILMLITKNISKPFKIPIHNAKTMVFWVLSEKNVCMGDMLKWYQVKGNKLEIQGSLYRLLNIIIFC
jgi:hypothetical protein